MKTYCLCEIYNFITLFFSDGQRLFMWSPNIGMVSFAVKNQSTISCWTKIIRYHFLLIVSIIRNFFNEVLFVILLRGVLGVMRKYRKGPLLFCFIAFLWLNCFEGVHEVPPFPLCASMFLVSPKRKALYCNSYFSRHWTLSSYNLKWPTHYSFIDRLIKKDLHIKVYKSSVLSYTNLH